MNDLKDPSYSTKDQKKRERVFLVALKLHIIFSFFQHFFLKHAKLGTATIPFVAKHGQPYLEHSYEDKYLLAQPLQQLPVQPEPSVLQVRSSPPLPQDLCCAEGSRHSSPVPGRPA
jgi:hypothetical protein